MALAFPNRSRSYDEHAKRIRFTGYDGMFQVTFTVTVEALSPGKPTGVGSEQTFLNAFDVARATVEKVATKLYHRGKNSFELTAADF